MIKKGQVINEPTLNAAFMSKTEDNAILGSITTQGSIGIGTTTPQVALDINGIVRINPVGGGSFNEGLRINDATDGFALLALGGSGIIGAEAAQWALIKEGPSSEVPGGFSIRNNGDYKVSISTDGRVGIGVTSPSASNKLEVRADGNSAGWFGRIASSNSTIDKQVFMATYGGSYNTAVIGAHNFALSTWAPLYINCVDGGSAGGANVIMAGSGSVGIGTASPGTKLDVGSATSDIIRSYGGFEGNAAANIDGTGAAAYFPQGLYVPSTSSWIYGTVYFNGAVSNMTSLTMNGSVFYNDVSRYWLATATNWGIYWDTTDNRIEFHGAGTDRFGVDLDTGDVAAAGAITWSGGGSANANAAYTHKSNNGSDHSYINQSVTSTASPTFTNVNLVAAAGNGLRLWGSSAYSIYMSTTGDATWGGSVAGAATSDYNMYFKMGSGTNRGFVWLNGTTALAQLESTGKLRTTGGYNVADKFSITYNSTSGNLDITGSTGTCSIGSNGTITNAVYNDVGEVFLADEALEPGDVVMKNPNGEGYVKSTPSSKLVVGVVSDTYGYKLGGAQIPEGKQAVIGIAGRVKVKATGTIEPGCLLIASRIPGVACAEVSPLAGTIIGKALQSHEGDSIDRIEMLIMNA